MFKGKSIEIKWAVVFSIINILWFTIEKLMGLHAEKMAYLNTFRMLFLFPTIGIYAFEIWEKRRNFYKTNITFLQGFKSGMILTFYIAIFGLVVNFIKFKWISPSFLNLPVNPMLSNIDGSKELTVAQGMAMSFTGTFLVGVVFTLILATTFSLVKSKKLG